ncbi:MAG: hypothetical protein NT049_00595, partial [Planctomycetota bacterium]|nr:hypothetical protein [Planctomycetota bacterium]
MSDTCRHYRVGKCVAPGYDIGNDCNWGEADFSLCAVFKASTVRSAGGSVQAQVLASEEVLRNTSGSPSGDSPARRRDPVAPVAPTSQDPATQVGTTATASDVETAKRLVKAHRATVAVLVTSEEEQEAGRKTLAQAGSAEIR